MCTNLLKAPNSLMYLIYIQRVKSDAVIGRRQKLFKGKQVTVENCHSRLPYL